MYNVKTFEKQPILSKLSNYFSEQKFSIVSL